MYCSDPTAPVGDLLVNELRSDEARLDSAYRRCVSHALGRWLRRGDPGHPAGLQAQTPNARAAAEHSRLYESLRTMQGSEEPLWLRAAAWEALAEAARASKATD
jgi:hypothetical protein